MFLFFSPECGNWRLSRATGKSASRMTHQGHANIAVAHRVERTKMYALDDKNIQPLRKPTIADLRSTAMAQPLDLRKPLDLSTKQAVSDPKTLPSNNATIHMNASGREYSILDSTTNDRIKTTKVPPLGSTKYPLQRGLAYVQPRQARPVRPNVGTDIREASIERVKNTSWESSSQHQDPSKKNSLAPLQQRVRDEAASNAVLKAQATQAAQAAASMAMARHQAITAQTTKAKQRSSETYFHPTVKHLHPPHGDSNVNTHPQVSRSDRLAPVKPIQRQLSNADLRAYMVEEDLSRLPVRNGVHTEQDILKAYRALANRESYSPHKRTDNNVNTARFAKDQSAEVAKRHINPSSLAYAKLKGVSQPQRNNQDKSLNGNTSLASGNRFAGQVDARVQAIVKEQQEYISRRQRQLLEDVNNNPQRMDYATMAAKRHALIRSLSNQQQSLVQDGNVACKESHTTKVSKPSRNPEFLTAMTTYNSAGNSQNNANFPSNSSPPIAAMTHQKNKLHCLSGRTPTGGTSKHVDLSHSANIPRTLKRPPHGSQEDELPRKRAVTSPVMHDYQGIDFRLSEAQRLAMTRQLLMNSSREQGYRTSSLSNHTGNRQSSFPVRDPLHMARVEKERQLAMLQYAQMINNGRARQQKPMSSPFSKTDGPKLFDTGLPKDPMNTSGYRTADIGLPRELNGAERVALAQTYSQTDIPKLHVSPPGNVCGLAQNEKEIEPEVIDLTEDPSPPVTLPTGKHPLKAQSRRASRLPSYDDAIAARNSFLQRKKEEEQLTADEMTSVAKQLLSSSHEWIKRYLSGRKDQPPETQDKLYLNDYVKQITAKSSSTPDLPSVSPSLKPIGRSSSPKLPMPSLHALSESKDASTVRKDPPTVTSTSTQAHMNVPNKPCNPEESGSSTCEQGSEQEKPDHSQADRTAPKDPEGEQFKNVESFLRSAKIPTIGDLVSSVFNVQKKHRDDLSDSKPSIKENPTVDQNGVGKQEEDKTVISTNIPPKDVKVEEQENDLMQADSATLGMEERALQVRNLNLTNFNIFF